MRPTPAARGPASTGRGFSAETIGELLRALRARAADHPESPGLIASWPDVSAEHMPAACAELRRRGHPVHEVAIMVSRTKVRRGWALDGREATPPAPQAGLASELMVLLRTVAEPAAVPRARAVLTEAAEREGLPEPVRDALALAVTEACANVVKHAYVDAGVPGSVEVRAGIADAVLVVEVSDDGRGMVPRVDGPGPGLGLPLIAQLADVVEIRTPPGRKGTILRMQFGLERAPESIEET